MGCGYKGFNFVIFHLFIHAFFKALLFLTAGYIIHLLVNEQDTRKMGGLLKISQFSYMANSIGSMALIGFPFLSGFYSKEKILEELSLMNLLFTDNSNYDSLVFIAGVFSYTTLIVTILYSFKVLSEIFFGRYNGFKKTLSGLSYSESFIVVPLFILSILSIYSGYLFSDAMIGIGTDFWRNSFLVEDRSLSFIGNTINNSIDARWLNYRFTDLSNAFSMFKFSDLGSITCADRSLVYYTFLSESHWIYSQWIVPAWTFYYLFCIFILRLFFLTETRYYLFSLLMSSSIWLSFYNSLVHKYVYINRLVVVPSVFYTYSISYNFFYRVIEKGLLEQLGGYGIYNTISNVLDFKITRHTFLLYHYLGLVVVSLFILFFFLVSFI